MHTHAKLLFYQIIMDLPFIFDNAMISHMVFIVISCITLLENSKRISRKVDIIMMM
jgi:hypothetical protein